MKQTPEVDTPVASHTSLIGILNVSIDFLVSTVSHFRNIKPSIFLRFVVFLRSFHISISHRLFQHVESLPSPSVMRRRRLLFWFIAVFSETPFLALAVTPSNSENLSISQWSLPMSMILRLCCTGSQLIRHVSSRFDLHISGHSNYLLITFRSLPKVNY